MTPSRWATRAAATPPDSGLRPARRPTACRPRGCRVRTHVNAGPRAPAPSPPSSSDNPGSGYSHAPTMVIRDGTIYDPIISGGSGATATATLALTVHSPRDLSAPATLLSRTSTITDATGTGTGAGATASTDVGGVTAIDITAAGSGYITAGGIKKFQDGLPRAVRPCGRLGQLHRQQPRASTSPSASPTPPPSRRPRASPPTRTTTSSQWCSTGADELVAARHGDAARASTCSLRPRRTPPTASTCRSIPTCPTALPSRP